MTVSKPPKLTEALRSALAPRVIEGCPELYSLDELQALIQLGLQYGRGLLKARSATTDCEHAEEFRRRMEIIYIFRGFSETTAKGRQRRIRRMRS